MVTGAGSYVWRGRPVLTDAVTAGALLVVDLLVAPWLIGDPRSPAEATLTALTLAAVPLRSRLPVPALALTTAGAAALLLLRGTETFAALAPLLALYVVALRSDRRSAVLAWASTVAVLAPASALGSRSGVRLEDTLAVLPWTGVVAAVGNGLRNRRAYLAAVEERAARAELSREQEAARRVAEERVRIARELHDVVAHHIAVVTVQAGAAEHLLPTQPAAAAEALGHVRRSAGAVLAELGDILSVLRQPGEPVEAGAPAPGLARLEGLVGSFAAAGLAVEWSLRGQPRPVPPLIDLIAYRVLEEGLTNSLKHGTGSAHIDVEYRQSSLRLRVVNGTNVPVTAGVELRLPPAQVTGTGLGLLGMRERAAAVGGTLSAAPGPGDTFRVQADLPLEEASP